MKNTFQKRSTYIHRLSDKFTTGSIVKEETSDVEEDISDQWFVMF